uniref:C-type lectin domain-containing protein n=1 Tax=Astyanax mexicanus TaxID=7994 RepID=A0A3B1JLD8_ASTMX
MCFCLFTTRWRLCRKQMLQTGCRGSGAAVCSPADFLLSGWKYFNSSFYYISTEKKSWKREREMYLYLYLFSLYQYFHGFQEFINKEYGRTEAWIGLTDAVTEKIWKWVDGSELTTEFWWTEELNDYGGDEDCAITSYQRAKSDLLTWADYPCGHHVSWICEKRLTEL